MLVKILGCGPSVGVPIIGCDCNVCTSTSPYNKRGRSSILIENKDKNILVDFGADIRSQLLREKVKNIQAAILTHDHADHVNGIEDLKIFAFYNKHPLNIYSDKVTLESIQSRFYYMFKSPDPNEHWGSQRLRPQEIDFFSKVNIEGVDIQFFKQHHGRIDSLGFRINNFVYSNDLITFPQESEIYLQNIDVWVLDCIEEGSTAAHSGLVDIIKWVEKFKPKQVYLTNMNHTLDYDEFRKKLPAGVLPAYDGLTINI